MTPITFHVYGVYGEPRPVAEEVMAGTDTNWRCQIEDAAMKAYSGPVLTGPLALSITFFLPRPAAHYSSENKLRVKESAPAYPATQPDTIQLAMAVVDALTGLLWRDKSQIVTYDLGKRYSDRPVVCVEVRHEIE